jgi:hypothetical protein
MRAFFVVVATAGDFERGFIKAEVVAYDDFKAIATRPGMGELKDAGKFRQVTTQNWLICPLARFVA